MATDGPHWVSVRPPAGGARARSPPRGGPMTTAASYEMLDPVGAGSTGTVYRARHTGSGEVVAIKEVAAAVRTDPAALARLRAEAQVLTGLAHPNVVRVVDVVDEPDRLWLVL